ncbi:flagellar basal body-associated FliL family protein [Oceanospirillum maris]|uniref:flagellar basal body-associated FliL family protein n=1 Tax=Oceanospirillum maris TaxID=64977 RepID=UPI0003F4F9B9|nr:flagellar basal body-associated FliL family protein [Oceanospirillum maris]
MEDLNEQKQSNKKTIIIIAVVVLLSIAAAVGGTLYFFGGVPGLSGDSKVQANVSSGPQIIPSNSIYYSMEPAFVINFNAGRKQRFMQVYVAVKAQTESAVSQVERHAPVIRNNLNQLFAKQDFESIQTPEGREEMRQAATQAVQDVLAKHGNGETIDQVLFTNLVMQ